MGTGRFPLSGGRTPELDGCRAIAVWMVMVSHLIGGWPLPAGALDGFPKPLYVLLGKGWLGVDLFFVLSGLLITGILLDSRGKPFYFRNFYGRRALRIVPVYLAVIAVGAIAYRGYAPYFAFSTAFLANVASVFGVSIPHGPEVFWSLCVEEHFYLAWPILVLLLSRRRLAIVCVAICICEPILRGLAMHSGMNPELEIYPRSWFRFDGLALGALLALWTRSPRCSRANSMRLSGALLALSLGIVAAGYPFGVLGTKTVASTALRYTHMQLFFAAGILTALTYSATPFTAWLRTPFMRVSSDLSYCVYLTHLYAGDFYHWLLRELHIDIVAWTGPRGAWLCQSLAVVMVTFGIALLSRKYLEDPCLRLKRYFNNSAPHPIPACATAANAVPEVAT